MTPEQAVLPCQEVEPVSPDVSEAYRQAQLARYAKAKPRPKIERVKIAPANPHLSDHEPDHRREYVR